jgi:Protein of unknown function (DUF1416)
VSSTEQASTGGCGAQAGGIKVTDGGGDQAVVRGRVSSAGSPVASGYARLLNCDGEFVAEVPLGEDGGFTFYAATGDWTLRVLAPGGIRVEQAVSAKVGKITELDLAV